MYRDVKHSQRAKDGSVAGATPPSSRRAGSDVAECATARCRPNTRPFAAARRRPASSGAYALATTLLIVASSCAPRSADAASDGTEFQQWRDRLAAAVKQHDAPEEVLCLTTIGRRWNWALTTLPRPLVEQSAWDSEWARVGPSRIDMLQMLYAVRWVYADGSEPSRWWLQLSLSLLDRNQTDEAVSVAAHVTDPYALIAMQADNRYKRIARSEFVQRDVLKAAKADLERRQAAATRSPRELSRINDVARALLRLHQYDAVLQLTDPVLRAMDAADTGSAPYDDVKHELPWSFDARADAMVALGRYDEGVALLRRAVQESKDDPLSFSLNLASLLARLDHPQEALAAVPDLKHASAYGRAKASFVQVQIASQLSDTAQLETALAELRTQAQKFPTIFERALLVADRNDEAAAQLTARLADPELRSDALVSVQDYADPPAPPRVLTWRQRELALRARADVQRAIDAYGHIRRYQIPRREY